MKVFMVEIYHWYDDYRHQHNVFFTKNCPEIYIRGSDLETKHMYAKTYYEFDIPLKEWKRLAKVKEYDFKAFGHSVLGWYLDKARRQSYYDFITEHEEVK